MAYRFQVNQTACINCGICMDLCPVRCLDMSRPAGEGEIGSEVERLSPIPGDWAQRLDDAGTCTGHTVCGLPGMRAGMPYQRHHHK